MIYSPSVHITSPAPASMPSSSPASCSSRAPRPGRRATTVAARCRRRLIHSISVKAAYSYFPLPFPQPYRKSLSHCTCRSSDHVPACFETVFFIGATAGGHPREAPHSGLASPVRSGAGEGNPRSPEGFLAAPAQAWQACAVPGAGQGNPRSPGGAVRARAEAWQALRVLPRWAGPKNPSKPFKAP